MRRAAELADAVLARPGRALAVVVVGQLGALAAFALTGPVHNGWLYYQGGDQIWYTTTSSLLAGLELPPTRIGYGWSLLTAPFVGPLGPDYVSALPPIVLLNVLVLAPLATVCVYLLGARVAGRAAGLWLAALWTAAPYASLLLFTDDYHERWVDQFLPQALGLTAMADYPSMVLLLVAATLVVRSLDAGRLHEALAAALVAGFAVGAKPSNTIFLAGPVLAYALARRWREGLAFAIGLAPALLTLALWKQRGLGELPAFALGGTEQAAGLGAIDLGKYLDFDQDVFRQNMSELREWFWSARLAQWVPLAGAIALGRRSLPVAGLAAGWFFAYLVTKGANPLATVASGSFFRLLMPAWPAYLLLLGALPLLVPTLARRLGRRLDPVPARPLGRRAVVVLAAGLAAVPLAVVAVSSPIEGPGRAVLLDGILTPVDDGSKVPTRLERSGEAVRVSWEPRDWNGDVFYRVYRTAGDGPDTACATGTGAASCTVTMLELATTRDPSYVDRSPPPGVTYRVGVAGNWLDDPEGGDVFVLGAAVEDDG